MAKATVKKVSSSDFQKMLAEFENQNSNQKSFKDDRFYSVELDKAGNGSAVIRFLPRGEGDELPWVKYFHHSFQGPTGKWFIENSRTTLGEDDPVAAYNTQLWNTGSKENQDLARKQKRKLTYISKVLVISDSKHPEKEGNVYFFKYGKKIFDKIKELACPTFEEDQPRNIFDLELGCDFKLRICKVEGYANYEKAKFEDSSELEDSKSVMAAADKLGALTQFLDLKLFKSYEDLEKKLNLVLYGPKTVKPSSNLEEKPAKQIKAKAIEEVAEDTSNDSTASYFQSLADSEDIPF